MPRLVIIQATIEELRKLPDRECVAQKRVVNERELYVTLPGFFTTPSTWPATSNLHCWECGQTPASYPKFIPTSKYRTPDGTVIYSVRGVFHDWPCAVSHILLRYQDAAAEYLEMLCEVEELFSGRRCIKMAESVSKFTLRHYIGDTAGVTVEQWNAQNAAKVASETIYADSV